MVITEIAFATRLGQDGAMEHAPQIERPFEHGYIAQWLERLTADQQVPGSNQGVPFFL